VAVHPDHSWWQKETDMGRERMVTFCPEINLWFIFGPLIFFYLSLSAILYFYIQHFSVPQIEGIWYRNTLNLFIFPFLGVGLGFEFRALGFQSRISTTWATLPFFSGTFGNGILRAICLGWPSNAVLLISAS
jgi:hypothetical protein